MAAKNSTGAGAPSKKGTPPADTKWPKKDRVDACAKLPPEIAGEINPIEPQPKEEGSVAKPIGEDLAAKEVESTPANSWLMRSQIQTFAKGALVGLVIGSLLGPIGLIAGPLIGGLLIYGMAKYDAVKADKASKKKEGD